MCDKGKVRNQGCHGLQGLQRHPQKRLAFYVSGTQKRKRYLQAGLHEKNLVSILRHSETNDAHVRIPGNFFFTSEQAFPHQGRKNPITRKDRHGNHRNDITE